MHEEVLAALERAWRRSDAVFEMLAPGALLDRPIPLRHPFVFYLGHLPAFAWNQVMGGVLGVAGPQPDLDRLFERGIDPLDASAAAAASIGRWPDLPEILAYRDRVRAAIRASGPAVAARADDDVLAAGGRVYHLVLEHELMHHETLAYMLQALPLDRKCRPEGAPRPTTGAPSPSEPSTPVDIGAGRAVLGADFDRVPFGWDNEFDRHEVPVDAFRLDRLPASHADWLKFIEAGGYEQPGLWTDKGWAWLRASGRTTPAAWRRAPGDGSWRVLSMFDEHGLEEVLAWPVHVSLAEARAYARWRGGRLPTEAELQHAAFGTPAGPDGRRFPWGDASPGPHHGAFGFQELAPRPLGTSPASASAWGAEELVGNGWEWTSTPFRPLPGFKPWARTYPGYSADFFDDEHFVVFGAAWPTDLCLTRPSLRNWYQGHYPWAFATVRLAWPAAARTARPAT